MLHASRSLTSLSRSKTWTRRYLRNDAGAVAPIFAAALSGLLMVVGTTVEYGRRSIARAELQIAGPQCH